ncbi:uncharacterized protein [Physcomitrium patens]|uniref:Uncharacterized protein n=1 Tax=Physcomitrium patens TaxID=3218 RepID=A0A2K1JRU6_PHYPA|nr:uncharacterized protein LOC112289970 [Physcomitrium patens]XP_024391527.1 uncharacterized protein LOC112289970 [Physcomitrium patens]XP_024391528.1 uncharacterized protein LOC112289970 [Physcomitrium patens]PNR44258.1 hypothetical protein PHYPA_016642 [Physcomitrium patens]|eukprot:XP_024391526.1 uncharacterized protein LOC112289970 [Physcomitrella patens]
MADPFRGHSFTQSSGGHLDLPLENFGNLNSRSRFATNGGRLVDSREKSPVNSLSKSRRTLRQTTFNAEIKAYPLPDPSQFETPSAPTRSSDSINDAFILYPMQSFKYLVDQDREKPQEEDDSVIYSPPRQHANIFVTDKQPLPTSSNNAPEKTTTRSNSIGNCAEIKPLGTLREEDVKKKEDVQSIDSRAKMPSKVAVVYDGAHKFTTAAVDIALNGYATSEGDVILVVAFLEHILSPMGMRMVADLQQFSGVNESVLRQAVTMKRNDIENKLKDTLRLQVCQVKKIHLDIKVLPGSNSKALVTKEIVDFQATTAIFDRNAMKNRKYYEENLSCHILRLRSDGRRVETVSLFGQGLQKTGSITSQCSDSSSDSSSSMNSELVINTSIWSKLKFLGSRRSSGSARRGQGSIEGSSRSSSNLGSPKHAVHEEDRTVSEVLEESFSFDSPKPNSAEAFVYAAAGVDKFGSYTKKNGATLPAALAA